MASSEWSDDFDDLLAELIDANAEFLIVGAHALAVHGHVRATGDLDILVRPSQMNADKVILALSRFGAPLAAHGVQADDFRKPGIGNCRPGNCGDLETCADSIMLSI